MNTNGITWSDEDVRLVEKFISIKDRGLYCDGGQLTQVYNRVLHKNAQPTSCGSCIRQRINELQNELNRFKRSIEVGERNEPEFQTIGMSNGASTDLKPSESISEVKVDNSKEDENKALMKSRMEKVRAAKGKKK